MFGSISLTRKESVKLTNFLTTHLIHCKKPEGYVSIDGYESLTETGVEVTCDCGASEVISED